MKYASLLKASVASAVILAGSGSAFAADAPVYDKGVVSAPVVAPMYLWQGFYAGLFAGYAWGSADAAHPTDFSVAPGFPYYFPGAGYDIDDNDGFFGGGQAGYNWQSDAFVFGLEGELGYMDLGGARVDPNGAAIGFNDLIAGVDSDFYGALTGRIGFAADQLLVYAKGGFAFINADLGFVDACFTGPTCDPFVYAALDDGWQTGWTVGAGAEWAFSPNWSAKVEYMYFDFGDQDLSGLAVDGATGAPLGTYTGNIDLTAHTVKLGVNYRF